ncbi:MAG: DUF1963 domain-containing protein [Clostridia bacterium]|nr:DUF1963 domain-containing protein [Clostridia bacterium]
MLIVLLRCASICWLSYYHTIKPNSALRKTITARIVFALCFLLSFLIPTNTFGKEQSWLIIIMRILDLTVWGWIVIDWILYARKLPKANHEFNNNLKLETIKQNLVNFAFDNFLEKGKDYTVVAEVLGAVLVRKIPRWAYCMIVGDKKVRALFSIETDKGIYCFQVDEEKFKQVDTKICTSIYPQLLPEDERLNQGIGREEDQWEKSFTSKEFQTFLQKFEHLSKNAAELVRVHGKKHGFSKFGGLPTVPIGFVWPKCDDISLQFAAQIDFTEINANKSLKDLPTAGQTYHYITENSHEENDCKILFFEANDKLSTAPWPDDLEMIYKEIYLTAKPLKTYPNLADCAEADQICSDNPEDFMKDIYERYTWNNMEKSFVGGWGSYLQDANFLPEQDFPEDWLLLCQIGSNSEGDDNGFMWSDAGTLYLYIKKTDLQNHQFNHVKLDLQCG